MEDKCERVRVQGGVDQSSVRASYSQDGRWMFVCAGCAVNVYSTVSHELVHVLSRHKAAITSCCLNPRNSLQLLTVSLDGKVMIWDYLDGSFLREIEFGVPLFHFAIRPGKKEPRMFFQIEKGTMEVDSSEGIELGSTETADKVIIGLPSEVIVHRDQATPPAVQLSQATECLHLGSSPSDMCFSFNGEFVLSYAGKSLVVCNISKNRQRSFPTSFALGAIAGHPSELCVATGNERGEVEVWYGWTGRRQQPVKTVLHWHAHAVADLCFTTDGTFLLSGGEECVLVVWQLGLNEKHFRPRLGAPITRVSCAPADQNFAVSLQNNIIQVVSGLNNNVEWTVGGLRRSHTQTPGENGMRTGLVWDPRSLSLVANSNPGSLQWYRPDLDQVTCQLDVTGLNYVSRRDEPLVLMTVDHAAFSSDGQWLATIEWRDDGKTTPEQRLKFWQFTASSQEFELNTSVEPPHNGKVTSLSFQPPPPPRNSLSSSTSSAGKSTESAPPLAAVSTSEDGKVKTWVLLGGAEERGGVASWACRSVAYYQCLPCRGACFSHDGSLLATNFKKCLTLWDPYTCELRKVFSSPFPPETFSQHTFGSKTSSHYLISTTDHHLIVWDLLRCSVLWSVVVDVAVLVADPVTPMAAAFVPSKQGTTHLYVFDPSSPAPVNVWESVCSEPVTSAAYAHATSPARESRGGGGEKRNSKLYFQTSSQVLYQVSNEGEDHPVINTAKDGEVVTQKGREERSRQAFFDVFGKATKGEVEPNTAASSMNHSVRPKGKLKVWDAAPHALPPLTSLAPLFLGSLLPSKRPVSSRGEMEDLESDGEEEERDSVEGEDSDSGAQERESHRREITVDSAATVVAMETDDVGTLPAGFRIPNFDWLTSQHFGEGQIPHSSN